VAICSHKIEDTGQPPTAPEIQGIPSNSQPDLDEPEVSTESEPKARESRESNSSSEFSVLDDDELLGGRGPNQAEF